MRFPIPVTVGQLCRLLDLKTVSIFNQRRNDYEFMRGCPDEIPEELKMKMVEVYYCRPDERYAIIDIREI